MMIWTLAGILLPLFGTVLGSGAVYLVKNKLSRRRRCALNGFAAGVMAASSVFSLILPALEQCAAMGRLRFLPPLFGFWAGIALMLPLDRVAERYTPENGAGVGTDLYKTIWAVTLHNIPEGMAVGVVFAQAASVSGGRTAAAFAFSLGIAIQNLPEGAIVSVPLGARGIKRRKAFALGALSGAVEPAAATAAFFAFRLSVTLLPYLLSFAAGAMIWVTVSELIPEYGAKRHSKIGAAAFCIGAALMTVADVAA